jgi:hypothetical protein
MNTLADRIAAFVLYCDKVSEDYWKRCGYTFSKVPKHKAVFSSKWCKVVTMEERNGEYKESSVHSFICLQDGQTKNLGVLHIGDIHKPASYKAPAKIARGNVFSADFGNCNTGNGIVYLR